jgi:alkylated DNA repair dioxygenase AlkB
MIKTSFSNWELTIIPELNNEYSIIAYYPDFLNIKQINELYTICDNNKNFIGGTSFYGTEIPRKQIWFHEKGSYFTKEWNNRFPRWESHTYQKYIKDLQNNIQNKINHDINLINEYLHLNISTPNINSCLINKYKNGYDNINAHRDNHLSFGDTPTILGLSIGSNREIKFNRIIYNKEYMASLKKDKKNNYLDNSFLLESGSLFMMAGATQKYFSHEIPKNKNITDPRYSFTFREHLH